jgi:iron-sulfur cluster repair protein YtfE (RIC family)
MLSKVDHHHTHPSLLQEDHH